MFEYFSQLNAQQQQAYAVARAGVAWAQLGGFGVLKLTGADVESFLQTQVTNDVKNLENGHGQWAALLDRKAFTESYFCVLKTPTAFYIVAEPQQLPSIQSRLDQYLFTEDVQFEVQAHTALLLTGPETNIALKTLSLPLLPAHQLAHVCSDELEAMVIRYPITGDDGALILMNEAQLNRFQSLLNTFVQVDTTIINVMRVEAGVPWFGVDFDASVQLPATGLQELAVNYNKGCYQGQEVVAKVKTYGSLGQSLSGLVFETPVLQSVTDANVQVNGQNSGVVKSNVFSPQLNKTIALAYLDRNYRTPGQCVEVNANGQVLNATVVLLPFYKGKTSLQQAQFYYETGLEAFAKDDTPTAITSLKKAIDLNPQHADAYESLGVLLGRQGQLDEAIALMQALVELTPEEVMPHTNLSVFYAQKGMIEAAETEKAKATTLAFKQAMAAKQQTANHEAMEAERIQQLQEKQGMFETVLADDPEDPLANYGLGQVFMQLKQFEKALPYLEASKRLQPKHSLTYVQLANCLEQLKRYADAKQCATEGLAVATTKGDLMPVKQLESSLERLNMAVTG